MYPMEHGQIGVSIGQMMSNGFDEFNLRTVQFYIEAWRIGGEQNAWNILMRIHRRIRVQIPNT